MFQNHKKMYNFFINQNHSFFIFLFNQLIFLQTILYKFIILQHQLNKREMSGYNKDDQEDQIPLLIPLKKKKGGDIGPVATPSEKNSVNNDTLNNIIKESIKNTPTNQQSKDFDKNMLVSKKQPNPEKLQQFEKKSKQKTSTVQRKDNQLSRIQNQRTKQNEKMKSLIAQMLNSMSVKNMTQQLYPVSNEAIQQLLSKIQEEITELSIEAEKKQSTLNVNQNNLHLKKELQILQRQIDHCCLIKELYYEKMNYRNKIKTLEEDIINLHAENKDLKSKVSRNIETIQNYKHNLPCDKEKQLKEKLVITSQQLTQQREMRQNLQKNIQSIIMNFKRLYDEADAARQIVTKKLREVEEREKKIRRMKQNYQQQKSEQLNAPRRIPSLQQTQQKKQPSVSHLQSGLDFAQTKSRKQQSQLRKSTMLMRPKVTSMAATRQKEEKDKKPDPTNVSMSLQQKIKKMRNNQMAFNRAFAN